MPFISFIYRIGNNPKVNYGKYFCETISDDHSGLDREVRSYLEHALHKYRIKRGLPELKATVHIGVMSLFFDNYIPSFSTKREIKCFDFYKYYDEVYINGKLIENSC